MNITCLIVDDEPLAVDLLANYISRIPYLQLKRTCFSAIDALEFLSTDTVDLIFADVNMPLLTGMEFAKKLPRDQKIIFTTAYANYAVESYSVNTIDYLLKPIVFERFIQAIIKAASFIQHTASKGKGNSLEGEVVFIKSGKAMVKVNFTELFFIEGLKDHVVFTLEHDRHIVYKKMKDLEAILPPNFARVQHSFIVNMDHILKIEDNHVYMLDERISIGTKYRDEFLLKVKSKLL